MLGDQRRFMVPIYQRDYQWREPLLRPFWEDVLAKAEEAEGRAPKFMHYMGALIIAPGADGYTVGVTPKVQVVDGQQRLTTFQLFLAAMREVGDKLGFPEIGQSVQNYIFNRPMSGDVDPHARFKLVPTPQDQAMFYDIIDGGLARVREKNPGLFWTDGKGSLRTGSAPNPLRALNFFGIQIERYAYFGRLDADDEKPGEADDLETQRRRLHALLQALLSHLKLVVITLDEKDDAQVIFETLNSKREPLLAMDLVRNNIFYRAERQGKSAEDLYQTLWRPFDDPFWKADSPRAKPKRPRIDHFLSHALTAQTGEEASLRELYASYRAFARPHGAPRFATVEEELGALLRFAPIYRGLELAEGGTPLEVLGGKLAVWEVATAYPLVFCVAASQAPEEEKRAIYRLLYAYIVRRALCGFSGKNFNKNFQRMVALLLRDGVSLSAFAATFDQQTGENVRFPDDAEFKTAIRTKPIYQLIHRSERLQDVLWEIEGRLRTRISVNTPRPAEMSIEHVLPQSWMANWPLPDGRDAPADRFSGADPAMLSAVHAREGAVHTLGNLTLVTVPGNIVASNSGFPQKRDWLRQSLLALNLEIIDQPDWNEAAISARGTRIADLAVQIWPGIPSGVHA